MALTEKDYKNALLSQSAVNTSGLVHSLSEVMSRMMDEPECDGTTARNQHPITILYAAQIAHLAGAQTSFDDLAYSVAYSTCVERSGGS